MSNERMDRGPIGTAHALSEEAERWRSPAAGSGSDAGADAGGSQVQRLVSVPPTLRAGSIKMKQDRSPAEYLLPWYLCSAGSLSSLTLPLFA